MKTLYEILEVSETASDEIIEKAYKVLAKKYHPDLQQNGDKKSAEETMKKINEAYDVLSNKEKRKKYDEELKIKRDNEKTYNQPKQESYNPSRANQTYASYTQQNTNNRAREDTEDYREKQEELKRNIQRQYEEQYQKAYENYLKNLGYRIKYRWTWKRIKELIKTIIIIAVILAVIWLLPPTHKLLMEIYESNTIVKTAVDIIYSIFVGAWRAICSIFKT